MTVSATASLSVRDVLKGYLALTKPRIIELLLITTVPTMIVAENGWPRAWLIVATLIGGTLAAGGANAFNMVIDRDIDALMERTKRRPLVTGVMSARSAALFAVALEIVAFVVLAAWVNVLSAWLALSATAFYVVVYTLILKRRSKQNIVIGGAAGAVPVLVGWAAVTNSLGWTPVLLFLVIFLWTPPHFWALAVRYRDDYYAANVPMMPVVASLRRTTLEILIYSVILWALTLLIGSSAHLGWIYAISATVLGAMFKLLRVAALSSRAQRQGRRRRSHEAVSLFHYLPFGPVSF